MKRTMNKFLTVTCATVGLLGLTQAAFAASVDGTDKTNSVRVSGTLTVHNDTTTWNLKVTDIRADGHGTYAKVVIDRNNLPDKEFRSADAGPKGHSINFPGNSKYSGTRGAKIYACVDKTGPDTCTEIQYVAEN